MNILLQKAHGDRGLFSVITYLHLLKQISCQQLRFLEGKFVFGLAGHLNYCLQSRLKDKGSTEFFLFLVKTCAVLPENTPGGGTLDF